MINTEVHTNMELPTVGSIVEVTTKYPNTYYYTYKQQPFVYRKVVGRVVQNDKWAGADMISVSTGDVNHPISRVSLDFIDGIEIVEGKLQSIKYQQFPVAGSKGKMYTVSKNGNHYSCDCTGYKYHNRCKHIDSVKDDRYE